MTAPDDVLMRLLAREREGRAATTPKPQGFALTSEELFAKREKELEEARAANPIIQRIRASSA